MRISWADVGGLPAEDGIEAFVVEPPDDADVERATGLLAGQIGALRAGGGRVFLGLRRGRDVVAFAAFDPSFPGAMPFAAARPGLARGLLEAMRPHARAEHAFVRFVAEGDDLVAAMAAAGAESTLEVVRMGGAIALGAPSPRPGPAPAPAP
jgi:hypothetical protein